MIIQDRNQIDNKSLLVATSIGGSPIHFGHTRVLRDCKKRVLENISNQIKITEDDIKLLVIVNADKFLIAKHGFAFQDENARAEIIDAVKDVDYVFIHESNTQDIADALHYFQPHFFAKGGDKSDISTLPQSERDAMREYGTVFLGGCGGTDKVSSSSELIMRAVEHYSCSSSGL